MLSSGKAVLMSRIEGLSSGGRCYHLGEDVIIWGKMLSSGTGVLSSGMDILSSGVVVLSCGGRCYHLGLKCYHLGEDVIIWDVNFTI